MLINIQYRPTLQRERGIELRCVAPLPTVFPLWILLGVVINCLAFVASAAGSASEFAANCSCPAYVLPLCLPAPFFLRFVPTIPAVRPLRLDRVPALH